MLFRLCLPNDCYNFQYSQVLFNSNVCMQIIRIFCLKGLDFYCLLIIMIILSCDFVMYFERVQCKHH